MIWWQEHCVAQLLLANQQVLIGNFTLSNLMQVSPMSGLKERPAVTFATDGKDTTLSARQNPLRKVAEDKRWDSGAKLTLTEPTPFNNGRHLFLQVLDSHFWMHEFVSLLFWLRCLRHPFLAFRRLLKSITHCAMWKEHCVGQRLGTAVQNLPQHFFERKFDAVAHDLGELSQLADQAQMEELAESRTTALEVG